MHQRLVKKHFFFAVLCIFFCPDDYFTAAEELDVNCWPRSSDHVLPEYLINLARANSSYWLLPFLRSFSSPRRWPVLRRVCVCQAFIKQPKEGGSFSSDTLPALSHQSSPLEEAAGAPLSVWDGGPCERMGAPVSQARIPVCSMQATNEHPEEPFRISLHF